MTAQQGSGASMVQEPPVSSGVNPKAGKLVLAGVGAALALALAMWWSLGSSWTNSLGMEFVWIPAGSS